MPQAEQHAPERRRQIERLFVQAVDLPPGERAAFLDVACGADDELRREVDSLLQAFDGPGPLDVLERDLLSPLHSRMRADPMADPVDGRRVGPYRLVRMLGYGGMGAVYLAERAGADFEQRVALKLIRYSAPSEALRLRFLRERQILAGLEHPHIARFLDGGMAEAGPGEVGDQPYLAMEYVEGQPITDYCDAERLSVTARLRLFKVVCQAVHHAHQHLVVHRDLKPSNILVTHDGYVKLLDFGVAKLLGEDPAEVLTQTGLRPMTPAYAAPEQVRGEKVTTATDVYALGVVLYELLTGHRPYEVAARSPSEVEHIICHAEPPRPSTAVLQTREVTQPGGETRTLTPAEVSRVRRAQPQRLQRRLVGDLDVIVLKALAKEPARRYASAEALMEDLTLHLAGLPVRARGDTLGYRLRKFARRHRRGVAVAALLVLSLLAGLAGTTWQARRATQQAHRAEVERDHARQVSALLVDLFEHADPRATQGDTLTAYDLLDQGTARVQADLAGQPEQQAMMLAVLGRAYRNMGQYEQAQPLLEQALQQRLEAAPADPLGTAESWLELGILRFEQGRYDAADSLLHAALRLREEALGRADVAVADVLEHLGVLRQATGDLERAEAHYQETLTIRRAHHGDHHRTVATTIGLLAALKRFQGRYEAADSLFRQALAVQRALGEGPRLEQASTLNNLGVLRYHLADYAGAQAYFEEALAIMRHVLGDEHPEVSIELNNLAAVLEKQGDLDAAEPLYREALALDRRLLGEAHPGLAKTQRNLGLLLQARGRFDEAEALLLEALAVSRGALGPRHADVALSLYNLAGLHEARGDDRVAEAHFRDALALQQELLGDAHPHVARTAHGFGRFLLGLGRAPEAEPLLRQALATWEEVLPIGHAQVAAAQRALGQCLTALGRFDEAEPLLLDAYAGQADAFGPHDERTQESLRRLVELYEAWSRPAQAEPYRSLLVAE